MRVAGDREAVLLCEIASKVMRHVKRRIGMKKIYTLMLVTVLAGGVWAQTATTTTPGTDQSAKQDMKDAGHDTKVAAKKTGHAVKKTSKTAVHKSAHATKKAANKVENKTDQ